MGVELDELEHVLEVGQLIGGRDVDALSQQIVGERLAIGERLVAYCVGDNITRVLSHDLVEQTVVACGLLRLVGQMIPLQKSRY